MLEEADSKPGAVGRPLDHAGDVRHHEAAMPSDIHHPQVGMQRGEGVIGHFRACSRYRPDQSRFARIRQSQQSNVGNEFELQLECPLLSGQAGSKLPGRTVGARFELLVSPASLAAARDQEDLSFVRHVAQFFAGVRVTHDRPHRDGNVEVVTATPEAVVPGTGLAGPGLEGPLDPEIDQSVDAMGSTYINVSAVAAVAAIWAAKGNEFLATEAGAAAAAVAGPHLQARLIDEFHDARSSKGLGGPPRRREWRSRPLRPFPASPRSEERTGAARCPFSGT